MQELRKRLLGACNLSSLRIKLKECDWHRMLVSFWGSLSFIGLGATLLVFAPTLLDLANHLSVGVGTISLMFSCRAVGAITGSVTSGIILDKLSGYSYTTLSIIIFSSIATDVVLPLSVHIGMLAVFMFLNGVATGSLDNGVQVVLLRLWGDNSGPCMQVVHFCFAFGAFIAPLIAKPFITQDVVENFNGTCQMSDESNTSSSFETNRTNLTDSGQSNFAWAYWITSTTLFTPLVAFIYFSVKYEIVKKCCKCRRTLQLVNNEDSEENKNNANKSDETNSTKQSLWYRIVILGLLGVFMFVYVGLEVAYGSLIFTVAVTGELCFSKSSAAVLQSVFWGTFAFMRFFSVSLALLKVRASVMLVGNLSGSLLASIIMIFYPHNSIAIWIGSAVLGMSYASIYPTVMTWMSENTKVSGLSTAVLVSGGMIGDISLPAVFGVLVARVTPDALIYGTFVGIFVSAFLVVVLFVVAAIYKKKSPGKLGLTKESVEYEMLVQDSQTNSNGEVVELEEDTPSTADVDL